MVVFMKRKLGCDEGRNQYLLSACYMCVTMLEALHALHLFIIPSPMRWALSVTDEDTEAQER